MADGCWSRVGSSNSNLASWTSNRELDVAIQDPGFAAQMAEMFEDDLDNATEIVLDAGKMRRSRRSGGVGNRRRKRYADRSRLMAGAAGLGATVGAALTRHRPLGQAESGVLAAGGLAVAAIAGIAAFFPRFIADILAVAAAWSALTLLARAWRTRRPRHDKAAAKT